MRLFSKEGVRGLFAAALFGGLVYSGTGLVYSGPGGGGGGGGPVYSGGLYPGNGSAMSPHSPELPLPGADILVSTPSLPADGSSVNTSAVAFSWTGPSTGAAAGLGEGSYFALEVSSGAAFSADNIVINISTAIEVDSGLSTADGAYVSTVTLAHNTTYYWRVSTVDGVLLSSGPWSQVYSFVTDLASPASVFDLGYSSVSTGSITLSWTAPGDDGAGGVLNNSTFTIQHSTDSGASWSTSLAQINISTTGVTPGTSQYYMLGGLAANTSYYFRLWTKDDAGNYSSVSNAVTVVTLANPVNWVGPMNGDWHTAANWDSGTVPVDSDKVSIDADLTVVTYSSNPAVAFRSLTLGNLAGTTAPVLKLSTGTTGAPGSVVIYKNATLMQNTTAQVVISTLTMYSGSLLTHSSNTAIMQYAVNLKVVNTFDLQAGSSLTVDGLGYAGGAAGANGFGPGKGIIISPYGSGGGHGGQGANSNNNALGGAAYDLLANPTDLGSGGAGGNANSGGNGGGAVIVTAGTFNVNGSISANGTNSGASYTGGGAGGTINITAAGLTGTGGLSVNGSGAGYDGGGGGGGRVAVIVGGTNSSNLTIHAVSGVGDQTDYAAAGTIYLSNAGQTQLIVSNGSNTAVYATTLSTSIVGAASLSVSTLSLTNSVFTSTMVALTVTSSETFTSMNTVTVSTLIVGGDIVLAENTAMNVTSMTIGGNLTLSEGATLKQQSTSALVMGSLTMQSGSLITHTANTDTLRYAVNLHVIGNMTMLAGSTITVDGLGYAGGTAGLNGYGPGYGSGNSSYGGGGGGYGDLGGSGGGGTSAGIGYGSLSTPNDLGSGGGGGNGVAGGAGGGFITLNVGGLATFDGTIKANGNAGAAGVYGGGGGSGGSINVSGALAGNGVIEVNGGNGGTGSARGGGGGAGGRVSGAAGFDGTMSASGGSGGGNGGAAGFAGTSYDPLAPAPAAVLTAFPNVYISSVSVTWGPNGNPADTKYWVEISKQPDFTAGIISSGTYKSTAAFTNLTGNTLYYARTAAIRKGIIATAFTSLGSTTTLSSPGQTWVGPSGGDWNNPANWDNGAVPVSTDPVTINAAVLVVTYATNPPVAFKSLALGDEQGANSPILLLSTGTAVSTGTVMIYPNATLALNTTEQVVVSTLTMYSGSLLTHSSNSATMQYVVNLKVVNTFDLQAGSSITVDGLGYANGYGPGKGLVNGLHGSGGGHGGQGANSSVSGGAAYDLLANPTDLGSGGGGGSKGAGGGGAVILKVGTFNVDGCVSANGVNDGASYTGGGAGGTINIAAGDLSGTGILNVNGGGTGYDGGSGGGGRIAVLVSGTNNSNLTMNAVSVNGSTGYAGAGTIYLSNAEQTQLIVSNGNNIPNYATALSTAIVGAASLSVSTLTLNNAILNSSLENLAVTSSETFTNTNTITVSTLTIPGSLAVTDNTTLTVTRMTVGGDLALIGAAALNVTTMTVSSNMTVTGATLNVSSMTIGGSVALNIGATLRQQSATPLTIGNISMQSGSLLTHAVNSGTLLYAVNLNVLGSMNMLAGSSITVDGLGYAGGTAGVNGFGTGGGTGSASYGGGGGGYGGVGGTGYSGTAGGLAYGAGADYADLGSGGGGGNGVAGGVGGGAVNIHASGTVNINGTISANGGAGISGAYGGGGGAGGGVWLLSAAPITGGGTVRADGGAGGTGTTGNGGGGAGGRIWGINGFAGTAQLLGGTGGVTAQSGESGTMDTIPPAAAADLGYSGVSTGTIILNWTAPGDDGADGVLNNSTFTIQYSSYSAASWSTSLAQVNISTTGVTPGTSQYYTLGGLAANTSYYFRLWTKDDAGNYSALSNGATVATLIEPPTDVYFDEIGTATIVASAYVSSATFTGMELGLSGVNITTSGAYGVWGSTGNYWTTKKEMPTARHGFGAAVVGGKIYAVGGNIDGGHSNANEEYDPVSNTWATKKVLPTARSNVSVAVVANKIYVFGGWTGSASNKTEEYDPLTNSWATKASMPTGRNVTAAAVVGDKIFVMGGCTNCGPDATNKNERFDPILNTWWEGTSLPSNRREFALVNIQGKLYAVGGTPTGLTYLNTNEVYNPVLNTWATKTGMLTARMTLAAGVIGGKLYALGGYNGGYLNNNEEYDPIANAWVTKAAISTTRSGLAVAVINGKLYVMGGSDGAGSFLNTNEEYTPGVAVSFTGLKPNTPYNFKAKARNLAGAESDWSIPITTYTLAVATLPVSGLVFTDVFASSVTVSWSSGTEAGGFNGPGASYKIQVSTSPDFLGASSPATTFTLVLATTGLTANTTYYFRAQAYNSLGVTDHSWLALGSTVTLANPPVPQPLTQVSTYSITAAWNPNGNASDTVYNAQVSTNAGFTPTLLSSQTLNTSVPFSGLSANTTYYLRVNALNRAGSPTEWASFGSTVTLIEAPTSVYFDEVTSNSITASAYAATPAFTGLERGISGVNVTTGAAYGAWGAAGNYWTSKTVMPTARSYTASGVINGKLYIVGGFTSGMFGWTSLNEKYDPALNSWTTKAYMPTGRDQLAAGVINGKLYAVGGGGDTGAGVSNEEYDPVSNAWLTKAAMPTERPDLAVGIIGGKLYAVGGYSGGYSNTNEAYDPVANTWATKAVMPTPRYKLAIGVVGGKLYALGGVNASGNKDTNEEYDAAADAWSTKTPLPTARYAFSAGAIGGKLYVLGGDGASGLLSANDEYDPFANAWTAKAPMLTARSALSAEVIGGRLYAVGGINGSSIDTNEQYYPGVVFSFAALTPNTQYSFKAKARNAIGAETGESVTVSTYTLAVIPGAAAAAFTAVYASSFTVNWQGGANPAGTTYYMQLSTVAAFSPVAFSSATLGSGLAASGLLANTTYYARVAAVNGGGLYTDYLVLGSTVTQIETPASVYFDEIGTASIVASAYAPVFTGLERGISGVNITTSGVYGVWGSTGNYWVGKTGMPTSRYDLASGMIGGKLYVVGGAIAEGPGAYLTKNEEYDPAADNWSTKAPMPSARARLIVGVIGGRLYAVGGWNQVHLTENEAYDPVANAWATKAAMPTARYGLAGDAAGGKLYALGGYVGVSRSQLNEVYDPATDTWATKAPIPTARGYFSASALDGKLYALGGWTGTLGMNTNEEYDPAGNTWLTKAPMPTAREAFATGAIGGRLYALGGYTGSAFLNTSEEYSPKSNTWATKAAMGVTRAGLTAAVSGERLYALGGRGPLNTNEQYVPGVTKTFVGLQPNKQYSFKAKARNLAGSETGASVLVSTYTLAAIVPSTGAAFTEVFASSVTVNWSSGTAAGGFNGPNASYLVQASSMSDFSVVAVSSSTTNPRLSAPGLLSNTTYYFRARAYNTLGVTDYSWLVLGSTVTQAIIPAAADPAFTGIYSSSFTVHWDPNGNAAGTGYTVQVSTSEDFIPIAMTSDTPGSQLTASGLAANTSYYARVAAVSGGGAYTGYFVIGATVTAIETPADIVFYSVSSNTISPQAYTPDGFTNLDKGLSGISQARDAGAFGGWEQTTIAAFGGLAPNKLYSFKARARNQAGAETAESPQVSTYTLAAVSLPQDGRPLFPKVWLASTTVNWSSGTAAAGFNEEAALYYLEAARDQGFTDAAGAIETGALSYDLDGLWPNTTHYYRVIPRNVPGVYGDLLELGSTATLAVPVTGARPAGVFTTSVTVTWDVLPPAPSSMTCEGYSVEASTAPDFTGTILSSATDNRQFAALSVPGLFASTTYYFRVGSLNWNALPDYAAAVSTKTLNESEPPSMSNHENADYTWYRQNTRVYNVDFADTGGSGIAKFMVKAATGTNGTGMIPGADWTNVETGISSDLYTTDWQLPNGFWDLLAEGVTNYISVSVYDGAANSSTTLDAFKVFKDTTPPVIIESVDDTAWQNAPGAPNSLDFSDGVSRLDGIQYAAWSLPGQAGAQLVPWTDIALNLGLSGYTTDYVIAQASWALLQGGTNYLTLRAWDYAVTANTGTLVDAFVVLKDTAAPAAINTLAGVELSSYSARLGFAAPADAFSGIAEFAVQYASYTVAWSTFAVAGSSHVYVSTSGVTAGGSRAVEIAALGPNTTYYFRAWARDKAGNWSADSNSDPEVTLAAPPAGADIANVYVSSVAAAWGLMDAAGYILDASTAANFSGTVLSSSTPDAAVVKLVVGGLLPNTTYYLRAGVYNWAGEVSYSEAGSTSTYAIQPGSAAVFTAVTSVGVTVDWLANGNPAGTRYLVQESTNELLTIEVSSVVPGFTFAFDGLAPSTTYTFMVTAINNNGALSEPLLLGSTVTMPVPPVITAYTLWAASAAVAWAAGGNGEGTVYECDLSTAMDFAGALVSSSTYSTSLTMAPLLGNTSYYMRLRAVSPAGARTSYSTTDGLTLAAAPAWLDVLTLGPNSAGLYWDASGNSGGAANSAWSPGTNLPVVRYGHSAAVAGDRLYISGGTDGAGYKADVWFAPLTPAGQLGAWTQTRGMPAARYGHTMTALKGRLYIMGGFNGVPQSTVWSAPVSSSGAAGAWVAETPLPHAVYAHAAVAFGDFIYILGGYGAAPVTEVLYSRVNNDGTLAGWNSGPVLPGNRYSHAAALIMSAAGARLCVAGGNDGTSAKAEVWTAAVNSDGSLVPWVTGPALPAGVFAHSMAAVPGAVFVAGGNSGSGVRNAVLRAAVDPAGALSGWTAAAALPLARQSLAMAERGGRVLALGGFDGSVSKLETWALPVSGTEYRLEITGASFSSTPWLAAGNLELGALAPNAPHTFRVYARNLAGAENLSPAVLSTYTYAAQPSSAPFADVGISSAQAAWLPSDNPAGTSYEAQLSSDAAYALLAGSSVTANAYAVIDGLSDNITYYGRARAFNAAGAATAWTSLGTVTTRTNPGLDTEKPSMISHQAGDTVWRNSSSGIYDIDFADAGGAYLANFQVRASTSPGGIGPFSPDWVDVVTGINSNSYTADFSLEPSTFALLAAGTNYISVRVFDGNNNSSATVDAFYILKDTVAPVITDSQTGETEWRLTDGGTLYNVDFNDAASGLAAVEYSASANQGAGDAAALAWTPIAALTPGTSYYNADWPVDFAGLANDATNYISVRAWDMAGNTVTVSGIDVFKVLKFVSGPDVAITLPASAYRSSLTLITGTASDARSQTLKGTEVAVMDAAAGRYWDGAVFTAVLPKWAAAAGTSAWSYVPGVPWADGTAYLVVARSSDVAGNYSIVYASSPFTFDAAAPAVSPAAPADGATVDSVAAFSGTASDAVSGPAGLALKLKRLPDGKWWDFNAGTWTVSGSSAAAAGTAAWSYAPPALLKASLGTHTSYYFTLYAADNAVPANAAQFGVYGSTFVFLDDIAPAAITDLTASSGSAPGRISLAWTAPGDDGDGGLILYGEWRVQYSTEEAAVFSTASAQVITGFSAVSSGTVLTYPLTGLEPGETYYMRAWTRDDADNWAPLSNGATTQATPYPDRISGHVIKVSSEGITGVLVEAFDGLGALKSSAYTLSDGSGTYVLRDLAAGSYRVQATWTADDISSSIGTDGIVLGVSDLDFTLAITYELASIGGELTGYRVQAGSRAGYRPLVAAAVVELYQRNRLIATAPLDAAGRFLIKNLLPGKYVLKVPEANGGAKELAVKLRAGEALIVSPLGQLLKEDKVYAYPNPARRAVSFHLETDPLAIKQVTVFDITGRTMKEFINADFVPRNGGYEADWSIPAKVASGVYVYAVRVKFEATGENKKVIRKFAIIR